MTNGIGASLGTVIAGTCVVNHFVFNPANGNDAALQLPGWRESWFIFAAYALVVGLLFLFIFHDDSKKEFNEDATKIKAAEDTESGSDGFVSESVDKKD